MKSEKQKFSSLLVEFLLQSVWPLALRFKAVLVSLVAVSLVAWLLIVIPERQADLVRFMGPDWAEKKAKVADDYRRTLAQAIGGVVLVIGAISTAVFTYGQIKINREGQITDRFAKAIEQLGSPNIEVRRGGIYSLERIARDSRRDHWTIIETLSAFVREKAPVKRTDTSARIVESSFTSSSVRLDEEWEAIRTERPMIGTDIQAALTVLGRRDDIAEAGHIDLSRTDLSGAVFHGLRFESARFEESSLRHADFSGAALWNTFWKDADLRCASFSYADLRDAVMWSVKMRQTRFDDARLARASVAKAHLTQTNFAHADLSEANFSWTKFEDVSLEGAVLDGADFSESYGLDEMTFADARIGPTTKLPPDLEHLRVAIKKNGD